MIEKRSRDTARAACEANNLTAERNKLELRPYLGLDGENASIILRDEWDEIEEGIKYVGFRIKVVIKNFGHTPAKNVTWSHSFRLRDHQEFGPFVEVFDENHAALDIAPQDSHSGIVPYLLAEHLVAKLRSGEANIHGFFRMTYRGFNSETHTLQFRLICSNHTIIDEILATIPDDFVST